jgi:C4-dicarboxylate transporter DctM subunit
MVLYAVITGVPVQKLFMAGFVPGFLMGGILIAYALYIARKRGYPASEKTSFSKKIRLFLNAMWGIMTPVLILGGIFSGYFTPSEAAAVAVVYSLGVAFFVYKAIDLKKLYRLVVNAGVTSSLIMFILLLIAGMFMETASALIILTPIFLPSINGLGGNLVHFGLLVTVGLAIGMATPPVAIDIYVASAIIRNLKESL